VPLYANHLILCKEGGVTRTSKTIFMPENIFFQCAFYTDGVVVFQAKCVSLFGANTVDEAVR